MKSVRLIIFLLFGVGVMITVSAAQPEGAGSAAALSEQEEEIKEQGIVPSGDPQLARQLQQQEMGSRGTEIERVLQARHPALGTVPPLTRLIGEYDYTNPWIDSAIAIKQQEFQWPYDITSIAISPDGRFIAVGILKELYEHRDLKGLIGMINLDGTVRKLWGGHTNGPREIAISLKNQCIVTGTSIDDGIALWRLGDLSNSPQWRKDIHGLNSLAIHEKERLLVIGTSNGVQIIDLKEGKLFKELISGKRCVAVAISSDGKIIMAGLKDGTVHRWDQAGKKLSSFKTERSGSISALAISPDERFIAIGQHSDVELRDMDGAELRDLYGHGDRITAIKIGSGFIVTASQDKTVRIWNSSTGEQVRIFNTQDNPKIALSPDEEFLAIVDGKKLRIIWVDPNALVAVIDRVRTISTQIDEIQSFSQTHRDSIRELMKELRALLDQQNFDKQAVIELVGKIEKEYELGSVVPIIPVQDKRKQRRFRDFFKFGRKFW